MLKANDLNLLFLFVNWLARLPVDQGFISSDEDIEKTLREFSLYYGQLSENDALHYSQDVDRFIQETKKA